MKRKNATGAHCCKAGDGDGLAGLERVEGLGLGVGTPLTCSSAMPNEA